MRRGFSLIEMLCVILVISVLISVVLPCLRYARESGRMVKCASNLRQLYLGAEIYIHNGGKFSISIEEYNILTSDLIALEIDESVLKCPSEQNGYYSSYYINRLCCNKFSMKYFVDDNPYYDDNKLFGDLDLFHSGVGNVIYLDGSCKRIY